MHNSNVHTEAKVGSAFFFTSVAQYYYLTPDVSSAPCRAHKGSGICPCPNPGIFPLRELKKDRKENHII